MLDAVLTVELEPSQYVNVSPPATARYDRELLAQATMSPAVSVVVKGKGLLLVVVGGVVVTGGGMVKVVYPQRSLLDVRKGVVVMNDPEKHWQYPAIPLSGSWKGVHNGSDGVIVTDGDVVGVIVVDGTEALFVLVVGPAELPDVGVAPTIPIDSRTATV